MAYPLALEALSQGGQVWETFRRSQNVKHRDLTGAALTGWDLSRRSFGYVDLTNADLTGADLTYSVFRSCQFVNANLRQISATYPAFDLCDFTGADLGGARIAGGHFDHPTLTKASLRGSDLRFCVFYDGRVDGSDFDSAKVAWCSWNNLDLRTAANLDQVIHGGPSSIGLDTILKSQGEVPDAFLVGCGLPDAVVQYAKSLARATNPVSLYSCFISYSSEDDDFCRRLHADLQAAGVRCWFAPEDLRIGDPFRDKVESAIRLHDKLLLVLSEHSVASPWVETEVESALARERRQNGCVLFPIRIDDAVLDTAKAWATHLANQRHIGDFTAWKTQDEYTKAFERLLRDLRGERS